MRIRVMFSLAAILCLGLMGTLRASAAVAPNLTPLLVSTDPYSAPVIGQHKTEVEADTNSNATTIVSGFQEGRIFDGGSTSTGWGTSSGGAYSHGSLPGITTNDSPPGPYQRATDPAVTYDNKHGLWLYVTLALNGSTGVAILVSSSTNGTTWNLPTTAVTASGGSNLDKTWITCDDHSTSPFYGHCYIEYDDFGLGDQEFLTTSTDGGAHWATPVSPAGNPILIGGQPVVQPSGKVIVPVDDAFESNVLSFTSTNGGTSWTAPVLVSPISQLGNPGGLRQPPLVSGRIDGLGRVYVVWHDCRFEPSCSTNDIVMSTSTNGTTWTPVTRVPIDAVGSTQDNFLPGLGVDATTGGATAHLAIVYDYYPNVNCTSATCQLEVGFISSTNGGSSWSAPTQPLGPAMSLSWLANTTQGPMIGDYQSLSFVHGKAVPVVAYARAPAGSVLNEAMYSGVFTVSGGSRVGASWNNATPLPHVAHATTPQLAR